MEKFKTEIWNDFKVERNDSYTVIWPIRWYPKEEKESNTKEKSWFAVFMSILMWFIYLIIIALCLLVIFR